MTRVKKNGISQYFMESEIEIVENTYPTEKTSVIEKWAPWFVVLWLLYVMNTVFAWYSFGVIFRVIAATGIVIASIRMKNRVITRKRGQIG
jgi:hypothetical protein